MKKLLALLFLVLPLPLHAADPLEFQDGDRVVFLGNTLIEREPRHGYWETALTIAQPERAVTFRNLGWSGDTVWGEARARFGGPADGFKHLKDHVLALKPTVIILGYGLNESFAGPDGIPRFQKGLDALLDALAPAKARIVVLSPLKHEKLPAPLPDPTEQNQNLKLYRDVLEQTAKKRGLAFIDLFALEPGGPQPRTDNGIHLTAYGYWAAAAELAPRLHSQTRDAQKAERLSWKTLERLPFAPPPEPGVAGASLRIVNLPAGQYTLRCDGQKIAAGSAEEWAKGRPITGPDVEQVEKLRARIIEKNQTYFHRWRPQNETYLFLFRKGEQGQNAKEIPQFDPLVEKLEEEIARLKKPIERDYQLTRD